MTKQVNVSAKKLDYQIADRQAKPKVGKLGDTNQRKKNNALVNTLTDSLENVKIESFGVEGAKN